MLLGVCIERVVVALAFVWHLALKVADIILRSYESLREPIKDHEKEANL